MFPFQFVKVRKVGISRVNIKYLKIYLYETVLGFVRIYNALWIKEVECGSGDVAHLKILIVSPVRWTTLCFHRQAWQLTVVGMNCAYSQFHRRSRIDQHSYFGSSTNISSSSSINYYLMSHILPTVSFKPPGYHFVQ